MAGWVYITLAVAALLTSMVSAIIGMGGGILLLAVMLCFMSHGEAIPTHAAVQIASNGTRVLAYVRNVDRGALGRYVLGVIPGAAVGTTLLWALGPAERAEPYLKALIGAFILVATYLPRPQRKTPADGPETGGWAFPLMGLAAGTAALTVGAIGPLIAPLFARRGFVKERLIATKAVCQLSTHVLKIPAFVFLRDLPVQQLGAVAMLMVLMVIPGTLMGKQALRGVSERLFRVLYMGALTIAGLKVLVYDGLVQIVAGM